MLEHSIIAVSAFLVAGLTFFSGFGLGTLLMPLFALYFPVDIAVAATAVVHLANNLFKTALVGKHASWKIVLLFGGPAVAAAFLGAWLLEHLAVMASWLSYSIGGHEFEILPVRLIIGLLMILFAMVELFSRPEAFRISPHLIPLGGVLSGFFGGLSGHQGALRTMFLIQAFSSKEQFVATVAVIGASVDVARLFVYGTHRFGEIGASTANLVITACIAAFVGSFLGSRLLHKITMRSVRSVVGILLLVLGAGIALGLV